MLITLTEYARRIGRDPSTLRHKAIKGGFKTAQKLGRDWFIDEDEPYSDNRRNFTNDDSELEKWVLYVAQKY